MIAVVLVLEEDDQRLICGYAPQSGRSLEEKQSFHDELKGEWNIHGVVDLVRLGDSNQHVDISGVDGVYREYGVGQRNSEGRMLFESCLEKE